MELIGDIERAFASAIYPNRVLVAIAGIVLLVAIGIRARRHRWDRVARRHPRRTLGGGLIAAAVLGPLGWYLGSPLFLSTSIDEPPPVSAASPSTAARPSPTAAATRTDAPAPTARPSQPVPSPTAPPLELAGTFMGADEFHFGEGTARLIETAPGRFTLRLEDFAVRNGPDLYVYLSPDPDGYAEGAVDLGRLKADRGNQNYEVPAGIDPARIGSVVIWCRQFAVLFATAELTP